MPIILHDGNYTDAQRFRIRRVENGVFEFHTAWGRTINLQSDNANDRNRIHTWQYIASDQNNKFRIYTTEWVNSTTIRRTRIWYRYHVENAWRQPALEGGQKLSGLWAR